VGALLTAGTRIFILRTVACRIFLFVRGMVRRRISGATTISRPEPNATRPAPNGAQALYKLTS